jgi:hypothetical protein
LEEALKKTSKRERLFLVRLFDLGECIETR